MAPTSTADAPRCADLTRDEGVDPIGTAGYHPAILAVEVPLPWPRDVAEHPELAAVAPVIKGTGTRLQGILPQPAIPGGLRRVLHHRRPVGPFGGYHRQEHQVPPGDLAAVLADLATNAPPPPAPAPPAGTVGPRDVLVCSHGRRDACCGRLGTPLVAGMDGNGGNGPDGAGTRVWRTTHTGGHRFAPTALVLPEGTAWAFLDQELLSGILDRTLDVAAAARLYRGCTGLDGPAVQACDREALVQVGWPWLDHRRSGRVVTTDGDRTHVRLEHVDPEGRPGAFEATVEVARRVPVPECRRPLDEARKDAPELRVTEFGPA